MKRIVFIRLAALILLAAACQPTSPPVEPTAGSEPQALAVTWPAFGEAVDAAPVLQWQSFPGATHYQVWVLDSGSAAVQVDQDSAEPQLAISQPLPKGTGYNWTVQAQDANHRVLAELNSYFLVKADLRAVWPAAGEAVDGAPVLQWQAFEGTGQYQVLILDDQAYPPQVVVDQVVPETSFAVTPPLPPGHYSWTVRAQAANQIVLAELNSTFTVRAPLEILDPVAGAEVGVAPTFRWTVFEGATWYQVTVVAAGGDPTASVLDTETKGTEVFVDPPLTPEVDYTLTIRALDRRRALLAEVSTQFSVYATGAFSDCNRVHVLPAAECQVLVSVYQATGGPAWADSADWLTTDTPCVWSGVTCTDGHVTDLNLFYKGLTGSLPVELAELAQLRVLALRDNQLTGAIPPELGRLAQLVSLDLSRNQLTGSVPAELGQLPALEFMFLYANQLTGELPAAWGTLPVLRHLDLSSNAFTGGIPPAWGQLQALQVLRLGHNTLTGSLPAELGQLAHLTELDVSDNQLSGVVAAPLLALPYRALWGNELEGTVQCDGATPPVVEFQGISFTCWSGLAASVWPDALPAVPPSESVPFWEVRPELVRFTLAGAPGADGHSPVGASLSNQAQVLIYRAEDYRALDRAIRLQFGALRHLLDDRPATIDGDLPLLPLTNASQVLHARVHYLDFQNGSGVSYLTQYAMGLSAVNNQDLFYTFQGMTDDRAYYVAAFFPVSLPGLPATGQLSEADFAGLMADYQAYLANTVALLEAPGAEAFTPDLAQIDRLLESLVLPAERP